MFTSSVKSAIGLFPFSLLGEGALQVSGLTSEPLAVGLAIAACLSLVFGLVYWFKAKKQRDDGMFLLRLLRETHNSRKAITGKVIQKLRKNGWRGMKEVDSDMAEVAHLDMESLSAGLVNAVTESLNSFLKGKEITSGIALGEKIKGAFSQQSPDVLAKDLGISLKSQEKIGLKTAMDRNRKFQSLSKQLSTERDRFADDAVHEAVKNYEDQSVKVNGTWVVTQYVLDHLGNWIPAQTKLNLQNVEDQMEIEMSDKRNEVAKAIENRRREQNHD